MGKQLLIVIYNNILEEEINSVISKTKINGYTIIENVKGKGKNSDFHLGTNVFPDLNNMLLIEEEKSKIELLTEEFKKLKEKFISEGLKLITISTEQDNQKNNNRDLR